MKSLRFIALSLIGVLLWGCGQSHPETENNTQDSLSRDEKYLSGPIYTHNPRYTDSIFSFFLCFTGFLSGESLLTLEYGAISSKRFYHKHYDVHLSNARMLPILYFWRNSDPRHEKEEYTILIFEEVYNLNKLVDSAPIKKLHSKYESLIIKYFMQLREEYPESHTDSESVSEDFNNYISRLDDYGPSIYEPIDSARVRVLAGNLDALPELEAYYLNSDHAPELVYYYYFLANVYGMTDFYNRAYRLLMDESKQQPVFLNAAIKMLECGAAAGDTAATASLSSLRHNMKF